MAGQGGRDSGTCYMLNRETYTCKKGQEGALVRMIITGRYTKWQQIEARRRPEVKGKRD